MAIIEPSITPFIKKQFPSIYQAEDANFIEFMRQYYLWMEQQGKPLYYSRNFLQLMDVDTTTDDILVFIKEKYLKNIQFSTEANIRAIIKHSLDIFRSKGTQRCIDLLFRLVFNEVVEIYYPKNDLFRLSDGTWRVPTYLEISLSSNNVKLRHKVIKGVESGATAFVDDVIRRSIKTRFTDIAYISSISGSFRTGEIVYPTDDSLDINLCPVIIGSLSEIRIAATGTGQGFVNGDIVNIFSNYGEEAEALVINASDLPSPISALVENGGYGYTASSNVIVSDLVISLTNVEVTNNYARCYLKTFDTLTQGSNSAVVVGITDLMLNINNITGTFLTGETIVQHNKEWNYDAARMGSAIIDSLPVPDILWLTNLKGVFRANSNIIGLTSKATANVSVVSFDVGITNNATGFSNTTVTGPCITADMPFIGLNCHPTYTIANNLIYQETIAINTDLLSDWTADLDASVYNCYANTSANSGTPFVDWLTMNTATIGKIVDLIPQSTTYLSDFLPVIVIADPIVKDMNIRDKKLWLIGMSAPFRIGEVVTQSATAARGIVQSANSNLLWVQELRYDHSNWFIPTTNVATKLVGSTFGSTANIVGISIQDTLPTGLNAIINPEAPLANGNIVELKIIESGYGYVDNEYVWFNKGTTQNANSGYGYTSLITNGIEEGFYEQKGGFLSDQKKLFDGYYWQEWSYEISSSKTIDKYSDMMRKIGHVAGTKMFGRYVYKQKINCAATRAQIDIEVS